MLLIVRDKMKIDFVGNRIHLIHPDDNPVSNSENTAVPLSDHPVILPHRKYNNRPGEFLREHNLCGIFQLYEKSGADHTADDPSNVSPTKRLIYAARSFFFHGSFRVHSDSFSNGRYLRGFFHQLFQPAVPPVRQRA